MICHDCKWRSIDREWETGSIWHCAKDRSLVKWYSKMTECKGFEPREVKG